jgi:predicted acylesterase/phospholipase RssA
MESVENELKQKQPGQTKKHQLPVSSVRHASTAKIEIINEARRILQGEDHPARELLELCVKLEELDQFSYAADVLLKKIKQDEQLGVQTTLDEYQRLSKYIYKDHSLPASLKFKEALTELMTHENLLTTDNCETLFIAGSIYKSKWQFDHQFRNLEFSAFYFKKGFESWKKYLSLPDKTGFEHCADHGNTAVNFAYVQELMAIEKLEETGKVMEINDNMMLQLSTANAVRAFVLEQFLVDPFGNNPQLKNKDASRSVVVCVAEAYFGLRKYDQALLFIKQYLEVERMNADLGGERFGSKMVAWKSRSFSQQIFSLAYVQQFLKRWIGDTGNPASSRAALASFAETIDESGMNRCLAALVSVSGAANTPAGTLQIRKEGKTGLALSGGGFRASLFHIGVLAALAEQNKLKDVEVISCVSGGSIIGAFYYLKLKELLEEQTDQEIDRSHYINIVKEIEDEFLKGVQSNLRMRVLSSFRSTLRMLADKSYSRTHRLGELYEEFFYRPLIEKAYARSKNRSKALNEDAVLMRDLRVSPAGETGFNIGTDNWKRSNKVPQLVINATSVNTGHNWQFTATFMGEPPGNILTDIDVKPRLRRMYYEDAPGDYKNFRLGYAVGASSCVPVMFHPMPLHDLYEENGRPLQLELIDGGLHDNQGIAALLEQECNSLIISDASGQMPTHHVATGNDFQVFYRADNILQERLRELQFQDVHERNTTTQLNSLLQVHLKNGLNSRPVSWIHCQDPTRKIYEDGISGGAMLGYGILRNTQQMLSEIRTDLDSFNDVEAYALMYSGYRQTDHALKQQPGYLKESKTSDWKFLQIVPFVTNPTEAARIHSLLEVAKDIPLKVIRISWLSRMIAVIAAGLVLGAAVYWSYVNWDETVSYNYLIIGAVVFLTGWFSKFAASLINYKNEFRRRIGLLALALFGVFFCKAYLVFFNGLYNKAGRISTIRKASGEQP